MLLSPERTFVLDFIAVRRPTRGRCAWRQSVDCVMSVWLLLKCQLMIGRGLGTTYMGMDNVAINSNNVKGSSKGLPWNGAFTPSVDCTFPAEQFGMVLPTVNSARVFPVSRIFRQLCFSSQTSYFSVVAVRFCTS